MLQAKLPDATATLLADLARGPAGTASCLREASAAATELQREGMRQTPAWPLLAAGARPPQRDPRTEETDAGEMKRGWQYFASAAREAHFLTNEVLPRADGPRKALLR